MAKQRYAVLGATGQIGHVLVDQLLKKGHQVKAIGRSPRKLEFLKAKGAEIASIDGFDKESKIVQAFQRTDGVFCLIPPGYGVDNYGKYQDLVGEAIKAAIKKNSIRYVINLSSLGGHLPEGTGPIKGLYRQEQRLNTLTETNIIHLRPGYFMENFYWSIPVIIHTGVFKTLLRPDLTLPIVSTEDIGIKAAEFLDSLNFKEHTVFDFVGPRPLNLIEVCQAIGSAIGKTNLEYVQQSYEEAKNEMLSSGMKTSMADLLLEMYKSFNDERLLPSFEELTSEHKGKITIEEFARHFAHLYKQEIEKQKAYL
jgi:uncharacterized protein YbjT (DUF2867 family)